MKTGFLLVAYVLWRLGMPVCAAAATALPKAPSERMLLEEKHFAQCLAYIYSPALWISYKGSLYFAPKDEAQLHQVQALITARSNYVAFTDRAERHDLAARTITASGLDETWQKKLLLPYSDASPNLTPTVNRPVQVIDAYQVSQTLEGGDALIRDASGECLVMDFTRHAAQLPSTNLCLIKEGERAFATAPGQYKRVDAFALVGLSPEETVVLNRVVAAFQKEAATLAQALAGLKAKEDFEDQKARATDNNPYQQYLVARCYLEGKGTPKDEKLGREWMTKAAQNGSGDAKSYLAAAGEKSP